MVVVTDRWLVFGGGRLLRFDSTSGPRYIWEIGTKILGSRVINSHMKRG
jgi:hypothetical protein